MFRTASCLSALMLAFSPHVSLAQKNARDAAPTDGEAETARPRLGPPKQLLQPPFKWQEQSGKWSMDSEAGSVSCASDGTLAEYGAAAGITAPGRWLAVSATLTGTDAKAGFWLSGVRDSRGELLRVNFDAASGSLTGVRGQAIATLPDGAFGGRLELVLNFTKDKVTLHHHGKSLGEISVTYEEPLATPSLFVERGSVIFHELLLSGDPAPPAQPLVNNKGRKPVQPALAVPLSPPAGAPGGGVAGAPQAPVQNAGGFDMAPEKLTALKGRWNDYFGVHAVTAGPWRMVRQYDGPEFGIPSQDRHTGEVKQFPGPFAQVPVNISLGDFKDWKRKDARGLDENLKALVRDNVQALYIAPWSGPIRKVEQDQIYGLMKITYGAEPGAEGRLFFQWGDSMNDSRYGANPQPKKVASAPAGSARMGRGANKPEDLVASSELYLAPAIEAVRTASQEIYGDPRKIPVVAGSCSASAEPNNRAWYGQLFDRTLDGTAAPSLKGRKLSSLVDYLAVNYPFSNADNDAALQELWDRFCAGAPGQRTDDNNARPRGLWVTEEYGSGLNGSGTMASRAARFLGWVSRNELDADQSRLIWNFPAHSRSSEQAMAAAKAFGDAMGAGPLLMGAQDYAEGRLYRFVSGDRAMLLVYHPISVRRGRKAETIGEATLNVSESQAARGWMARLFQDKGKPGEDAAQVVRRDGNRLFVNITGSTHESWALLLEAP